MGDAAILLDVDVDVLSRDGRLSALAELDRLRHRVEAAQQRLLAALALDDPSEQEWIVVEVACVLTIPPSTAAARLRQAGQLAALLPTTADAMRLGRVSPRHAAVLLDLTSRLDPAVRSQVEERVLGKADGRTVPEFRRTVRRAVAAVDPRGVEERHADGMEQRRVAVQPVADGTSEGMSELWALLPADGAAALMASLTAIAAGAAADDPRTVDQRRADALVGLGGWAATTGFAESSGLAASCGSAGTVGSVGSCGSCGSARSAGSVGSAGGGQSSAPAGPFRPRGPAGPSVHVTIGLDTLLGFDDDCAELAGHGPIPAAVARRRAADPSASWRRIVTSGPRIVDAEATCRPSAKLRARIVARDVTCRFPGCSRPARRAETDHIVAWEDGGPTAVDNLHALCSRHHHLKHEAGWSVERDDLTGITWWRSPTGRSFSRPPDDTIGDYTSRQPRTGSRSPSPSPASSASIEPPASPPSTASTGPPASSASIEPPASTEPPAPSAPASAPGQAQAPVVRPRPQLDRSVRERPAGAACRITLGRRTVVSVRVGRRSADGHVTAG